MSGGNDAPYARSVVRYVKPPRVSYGNEDKGIQCGSLASKYNNNAIKLWRHIWMTLRFCSLLGTFINEITVGSFLTSGLESVKEEGTQNCLPKIACQHLLTTPWYKRYLFIVFWSYLIYSPETQLHFLLKRLFPPLSVNVKTLFDLKSMGFFF